MIKSISEGMSTAFHNIYVSDRGEELEAILTNICVELGKVGTLTENKADVEFVLGVVGSYLISQKNGKLAEDSKPPSYIFNDVLFPAIDAMEDVVVEEIPEDDE